MAAEVEVVRIVEEIECIQATVVIGSTPRPESVLFDALAQYLAEQSVRQAIVSSTFWYGVDDDEQH
jgi:hypothetical protein